LSTEDEDTGDSFVYNIVPRDGSLDYTFFSIIDDELFTEKTLDREKTANYTLQVTSEDSSGEKITELINVFIGDVNEPPQVSDMAFSVVENLSPAIIGQIVAQDPDVGQQLTYEWASIPAGFPFELDRETGTISLLGSVNYETTDSYSAEVKVIDNGEPAISEIIRIEIKIEDQPEAPTGISLSSLTIPENSPTGTVIGSFTTEDEDLSESFGYQIKLLSGQSGDLRIAENLLLSGKPLDFEIQSAYEVLVTTTDRYGLVYEKNYTIAVEDVNERPWVEDTTFFVNEDAPENTVLGLVDSDDEDPDDELTFQLYDSTGAFAIDAFTGEVFVRDASLIDYETQHRYLLRVIVSDGGVPVLTDSALLEVLVEDLPENSYLPYNNYISPNGDAVNDYLEILNVQIYEGFELSIFTPSGKMIYHNEAYDNSWDGRWNDRVLPTGTYYFTFVSEEKNIRYEGKIYLKDR
ncbi:MAG: cadherin domain-containing protein, partial [Cyclobacteriaceae bacterium]